MEKFLISNIVTRDLRKAIGMIILVTGLFFTVCFMPLCFQARLSPETWYTLFMSTAKFAMWFFLGYGGIQALGVKFEVSKLDAEEAVKRTAHARADFEPWTQENRDMLNDATKEELQKLDVQRKRIVGDEKTCLWLFGIGCTLFLITSVAEVWYLAFK